MESKADFANVAVLKDRKQEADSSINARRRSEEEDRIAKMDSMEFLMMAGGGLVIGAGIYLLSFLAL
ncbi:MAG TPA: hypothetical protein VFT51_10905 [Bacillales bacterium]|nr:hypothetical protein [Bacillales bacterium]